MLLKPISDVSDVRVYTHVYMNFRKPLSKNKYMFFLSARQMGSEGRHSVSSKKLKKSVNFQAQFHEVMKQFRFEKPHRQLKKDEDA